MTYKINKYKTEIAIRLYWFRFDKQLVWRGENNPSIYKYND